MVHAVDGHFVISSHSVWLPGAYDTERTARYAFFFKDEVLKELQDRINPGGVITLDMLKAEKMKGKAK